MKKKKKKKKRWRKRRGEGRSKNKVRERGKKRNGWRKGRASLRCIPPREVNLKRPSVLYGFNQVSLCVSHPPHPQGKVNTEEDARVSEEILVGEGREG